MSDTILAIIEMDRFPEHVAARAAWIARRLECNLELVLSDPTLGVLRDSYIVSNEAQRIADDIKATQQQFIDDLARPAIDRDMRVATSIIDERRASDAIIAKALDVAPKLVVKGTEHHSPAERATFTYTDWRLIRKLDFPLWLVKPQEWKEEPLIIAAVDPMHRDDKDGVLDQLIVDAGQDIAARCGGKLTLLHTYERLVEIGRHAMFAFKPVKLPIEELETNIRDLHREKLDALAAANDIAAADVHQLPGKTHEILPMFARAQGADLVIMGAVARTGLKRRVIGSTAERVLDHLPCDIFIARGG